MSTTLMRRVFGNRAAATELGARARADLARRLSSHAVGAAIKQRLERREMLRDRGASRDRVPAAR